MLNPLASHAQLKQSPSAQHGIPSHLEHSLRHLGTSLLQICGQLLRLNQLCIASAQILFQRFYYVVSFLDASLIDTVMGALFLASKLSEIPRKVKEVTMTAVYVAEKVRFGTGRVPNMWGDEFYTLRDRLLKAEYNILAKLGFQVHFLPEHHHAYGLLISYMRVLGLIDEPSFAQTAWNYLNDSLRTTVFVMFQPNTIACAAIELAARRLGIAMPQGWEIVFEANRQDIVATSMRINALYVSLNNDDSEEKKTVMGWRTRDLPITTSELKRLLSKEQPEKQTADLTNGQT